MSEKYQIAPADIDYALTSLPPEWTIRIDLTRDCRPYVVLVDENGDQLIDECPSDDKTLGQCVRDMVDRVGDYVG